MIKQIENVKAIRLFLLNAVQSLTVEQLNKMPDGLNNNIIWNIGHLIAAQQGVCYKRGGVPTIIDENFWLAYKPESKPEQAIDSTEIERIKQLFSSTLAQFEIDYTNNIFSNYIPWTTRSGIKIENIDDALNFLLIHEGWHLGCILTLKKLV